MNNRLDMWKKLIGNKEDHLTKLVLADNYDEFSEDDFDHEIANALRWCVQANRWPEPSIYFRENKLPDYRWKSGKCGARTQKLSSTLTPWLYQVVYRSPEKRKKISLEGGIIRLAEGRSFVREYLAVDPTLNPNTTKTPKRSSK